MLQVQGKQQWQPRLVQVLNLEAMVPPDHMLRHIDRVLDLSFVRERTAHLYCPDNGRPSIPPELVARMLLLGYLYSLSDVRLCQDVSMHAGFRWFCRLNFDDPVPDRTTLVKLRKRWAMDGVFEDIMRRIVQQCIDAGLVAGGTLAVDGTQVTANAAHKSLAPLAPVESIEEHLNRVKAEDQDHPDDDADPPEPPQAQSVGPTGPEPQQRQGGDPDFHGQRFANATHRSQTDRDARLYRKGPSQEAKLRHLVHDLVDVRSGVILATLATVAATWAERQAAIAMLDATLPQLPPVLTQRWLLADKGYRSTEFFAEILNRGLLPGVSMDPTPEPAPTWKRRPRTLVEARARRRQLLQVEVRNRVRELQGRRLDRRLLKARIRVEHLFAEAKVCHGLDRARSRGRLAVQTQATWTAIVQNLKRLVAWNRRRPTSQTFLADVRTCFYRTTPLCHLT